MDDDNACNRTKWPMDWLRTRGYILDDRAKYVQLERPIQTIERDPAKIRLEITLIPLDVA